MDFFLGGEGELTPSDAAVALIVLDDGRYLLQLRDQKPKIFYPGHWGLFGGATELGETPETALSRELQEELGLSISAVEHVTDFSFSFGRAGIVTRHFFEVPIRSAIIEKMTLTEGSAMRAFLASEILNLPRVVPYDSFAIWLHASGMFKR